MIGQVRAVGKGGYGVVFAGEKPVFLEGVIEDELVEFAMGKKRGSIWFGQVKRILESSPDRISPPCPYVPVCGGCNFQHITYPGQLAIKKDILLKNLTKIGRLKEIPPVQTVPSPPFHYRTKTVFKIKQGKIGFLKRKSHHIVEISHCHLVDEPVNIMLREWRQSPMIRNTENGEILVLSNGYSVSAQLKSAQKKKYLGPIREITFKAGDFSYRVIPENFIQANRFTMDSMIELVEDNLKGKSFIRSMDLFSGIGFFSLPLSRYSRQVLAVEKDQNNLASLKKNLEENHISNVETLKADIRTLPLPGAELMLVDPPRAGLGSSLTEKISGKNSGRFLYFSCDSATFSRDLARLKQAGRPVKGLVLVDNFPQTDHFEIFTWL